MEGRSCKTCESNDFSIENCETVCTTCGQVQDDFPTDEGDLKAIPDGQTMLDNLRNKKHESYDRLNKRIRGETTCPEARRQINRDKLSEEMRRAVKKLIKHPSAVDETMDLANSVFTAHKGRLLTCKKYGLVGACIYYLSAKHQLGLSLNDICKEFGIKIKVISVCLKQVKSLCPNFEYERPNIRDLINKYVDSMTTMHYDLRSLESAASHVKKSKTEADQSFIDETQPLVNRKDKTVLQNRIVLLLDLFEAMHPYNQPAPQSIITAVIYHAWRSLDTFKLLALNLRADLNHLKTTNTVDNANDDDDDDDGSAATSNLVIATPEENDEQLLQRRITAAKHSISYEKFCQLSNLKYSSNGHKVVSKLQSSLLMLGKYLGNVNKINLPWFLKDIIENSPHLIQEHMRTDSGIEGTIRSSGRTSETANSRED